MPAGHRRRGVLVVHYFFPPLGGAGVPRMLKFVKYLPELGWDVTVLTSRSTWYGVRDVSQLAEIPDTVRVVRAGEVPVAQVRRRLLNPMHRLGLGPLNSYIGWPDETSGWVPPATLKALSIVRSSRPDVVLSSSYPYSAHVVGLVASRAAGVPWIADFRDEWTQNPQGGPAPDALRRLDAAAERALVRRAERVVVIDDRMSLLGIDPADPRRAVIRNGVDPADVITGADGGVVPSPDRFRLTYVGTLYGTRDAEPVFEAIERLIGAGQIDPARFEVRVVGNVWLGGRTPGNGSFPVTFTGYVAHEAALREMRAATALLFYAPASTWAPSGKIFEYLISRRPILAVARPDNLAHQLVDELGAGAVAEPDDPDGIVRALVDLYHRWTAGTLAVSDDVAARTLERFSRRKLTEDLSRVMHSAIDVRETS